MRIGIDATTIYTAKPTGLGVYSINVIRELAKKHDDIVIWTVDKTLLPIPDKNIRQVMQLFRFFGNRLYQIRPFWVQNVLPKLIQQEKIDVLYSTIPNGLHKSPVPHVLTVHDIIPMVFPEDSPRSVRWNFKNRLPKIFHDASAIISVSNYTKKDLLTHYDLPDRKIKVISEGYDTSNFKPDCNMACLRNYGLSPGRYVLYVGNSSPRKNVCRLIEAFARLKNSVLHTLVLAGAKVSSETRLLRDCARKNNILDRVLILDYVPYEELPAFYTGSAVFAFLSEYEGFGLPVLEAMACGTPVLAANATSLPEVLADAGILVDPHSIDNISKNLHLLLTDSTLIKNLHHKSLARASNFSWEKTAQEILQLLSDAVTQ